MLEVQVTSTRGAKLDVTATLDQHVTGLVGRSGAGKTTLLHMIAGLIKPTAGRIVIDGTVVFDSTQCINLPAHKRGVGVVFQDMRLLPHYTVAGNLRYGLRDGALQFDDVVSLLELRTLLPRRPHTLSGGEQRRVAISRALLQNPRLLLMDEPLSSLDHALRRQILPYLRRVCDQVQLPIIYVSHELNETLQLTDHLILLDKGRAIGVGRYHDLVQQQNTLDIVHHVGLINVLSAAVQGCDQEQGVTRLAIGKGELIAPLRDLPKGTTVHVSVRPEDVALAAAPVEAISIQNQLPGRITRIAEHGGGMVAEIDVGQPLLVAITRRAVETLNLAPGRETWCLIKAQAVQYLDP